MQNTVTSKVSRCLLTKIANLEELFFLIKLNGYDDDMR